MDKCKSCRYFELTAGTDGFGRCFVLPPKVVVRDMDQLETVWPTVHDSHYCAYWNKIPKPPTVHYS